MTFNNFDKQQ